MYRNASDAVIDMRDRGFNGFELSGHDLLGAQRRMSPQRDEFMVIESHRFCVPAGRGCDVVVHGVLMVGTLIKGILIVHCSAAYIEFTVAARRMPGKNESRLSN